MSLAGSEEPISEALSAAVLGDENTLSLILTLGALSASDLASAAQVARLWRRVAGSEALWKAAWLREAPSLARRPSADVPGAAACRASLEQMRVAVELARGRELEDRSWRLDDFVFCVDVSWRGVPIFASTRNASRVNDNFVNEFNSILSMDNRLALDLDGDSEHAQRAALCARLLLQPDTAAATVAELRMRMFVKRPDGALACLLAGAVPQGLESREGNVPDLEVAWDDRFAEVRGDLFTHDDDAAEPLWRRVDLALTMPIEHLVEGFFGEDGSEDLGARPPPGPHFRDADIWISLVDETETERKPVSESELLRALVRKELNWVSTQGRTYI